MVLHAETIRHDFFTVSYTIETRASPEGTSQERPWSWETSIRRGNSRQRARKLIQKNKPNKTTQRLKVVKALKQSHSIREKSHFFQEIEFSWGNMHLTVPDIGCSPLPVKG